MTQLLDLVNEDFKAAIKNVLIRPTQRHEGPLKKSVKIFFYKKDVHYE